MWGWTFLFPSWTPGAYRLSLSGQISGAFSPHEAECCSSQPRGYFCPLIAHSTVRKTLAAASVDSGSGSEMGLEKASAEVILKKIPAVSNTEHISGSWSRQTRGSSPRDFLNFTSELTAHI